MRKFIGLALVSISLLGGCAHVLSDEARAKADPAISFSQLKAMPETYVGKHVILGGVIASTKNAKEGSQLEIVQFHLESGEVPNTGVQSEGRFLATTPDFLDPMVFKKGRAVTVFGEIKGKKTQEIDERSYTYPIIGIRELYLWDNAEKDSYLYPGYPPPGYYYDPFYYSQPWDPYWYSPLWWRPIGPPFRRWH